MNLKENEKSYLIFSIIFPPNSVGGIAAAAYGLTHGLNAIGQKAFVVCTKRSEKDTLFDREQQFKVFRFQDGSNKLSKFYTRLFSPLKWSIELKVKGIIAMKWNSTGITSLLVSRLLRIPFYVFAIGNEVVAASSIGLVQQKLRSFVLHNAKYVFAISNYTRQQVIHLGVEADRVKVIPMGVDPGKFV
jgi:glycosyltransferase involved in cell wall biosynthesis